MILDRSNKKVKSRISSTETKRNLAKFEIFRNLIKTQSVPEVSTSEEN